MNQDIEAKVEKLPVRARVAFAARCARRVLPIFLAHKTLSKDKESVEQAIVVAENWASNTSIGVAVFASFATNAQVDALLAASAASSASAFSASASSASASAAAYAAAYAASASAAAAESDSASASASAAAYAAAADASDAGVINSLTLELDALLRMAQRKRWDDQSPVSPDCFDALEDVPRSPDLEPSGDRELVFEIEVPEGVTGEWKVRQLTG